MKPGECSQKSWRSWITIIQWHTGKWRIKHWNKQKTTAYYLTPDALKSKSTSRKTTYGYLRFQIDSLISMWHYSKSWLSRGNTFQFQVNVYLSSKNIRHIKDKQPFTLMSLLSSLGGALSLYLGISLVATFELLELIIRFVFAGGKSLFNSHPTDQKHGMKLWIACKLSKK